MHLPVLALLLSTTAALAQVTPVPGTGCGNPRTAVLHQPLVGQQIVITSPFPCLFQTALAAVGTQAIVPWTGCLGLPCAIGVAPVVMAFNPGVVSLPVQIPNNPLLVGVCIRAQTACMQATCLSPDQAVQICVQ